MKRELSNCCCSVPCTVPSLFGIMELRITSSSREVPFGREKAIYFVPCHAGLGDRSSAWGWPLMKRWMPCGRSEVPETCQAVENEKWIKKNVRSERYAINKVKQKKKLHLFTKELVSTLTNRWSDCCWLAHWSGQAWMTTVRCALSLSWLSVWDDGLQGLTDEAASWAAASQMGGRLKRN